VLCAGLKTAGAGTADRDDEQDTVPTETNIQSTPFVTLSVALHSLNNVHTYLKAAGCANSFRDYWTTFI